MATRFMVPTPSLESSSSCLGTSQAAGPCYEPHPMTSLKLNMAYTIEEASLLNASFSPTAFKTPTFKRQTF